jgi:hypothetical protein
MIINRKARTTATKYAMPIMMSASLEGLLSTSFPIATARLPVVMVEINMAMEPSLISSPSPACSNTQGNGSSYREVEGSRLGSQPYRRNHSRRRAW